MKAAVSKEVILLLFVLVCAPDQGLLNCSVLIGALSTVPVKRKMVSSTTLNGMTFSIKVVNE